MLDHRLIYKDGKIIKELDNNRLNNKFHYHYR
jgi:hypothetical protein